MNRLDTMALPATLRSPGRATLLVLVLLVVTAAISGLSYKYLLGDLSDLWALLLTGLLVVTVGGSLLTRFVTWPLASRRVELFDETRSSETAMSHDEQFRNQFARIDDDLAKASTEEQVIDILAAELGALGISDLVELHVINAFDDTLDFVAANRTMVRPHPPSSPWDCTSATTGATITTQSTDNPDSCPHLRSRVAAPVSGISVPLTAQNGILGVLHATGPEGEPPTATAVFILEAFASRAALNLALQRSSAEAWRDHIDAVTSLPTVDDVTVVIARALTDKQSQAVAWLSIDNLTQLDTDQGAELTRSYQRWLASLLISVLPPSSTIGTRADGDFLLAISNDSPGPESAGSKFADTVERLEHVRAAVAQQRGVDLPDVTISAGVVQSEGAPSTVDLLAYARAALDHARKTGGNKVIKPGPES